MKKKNTTLLIALGCITLAAQGQTVQGRHHPVSAEASPYAAFGDTTRTLDCRHADYARYEVPVILDDGTSATLVFDFPHGKAVLKDEAGCVLSTDTLPEHLQAIFLSADPKATDYPHVSAYAYCMGNPMNVIDPDGRKIIFVNGKIGGGSPEAGFPYWGATPNNEGFFIRGAKRFFGDNNIKVLVADYGWLSSANTRFNAGYNYAKNNFELLINDMGKEESFNFVSHSMGAAFVEGMVQYLIEQNRTVSGIVHINAYQAKDIHTADLSHANGFRVDYQNTDDPVINYAYLHKSGDISSSLKIREKSHESLYYIHRSPITNKEFWKELRININGLE